MTPKMIFCVLAYFAAMEPQNAANCALVGPPWPIISPFHLASAQRFSLFSIAYAFPHDTYNYESKWLLLARVIPCKWRDYEKLTSISQVAPVAKHAWTN